MKTERAEYGEASHVDKSKDAAIPSIDSAVPTIVGILIGAAFVVVASLLAGVK